ncbi:MAG: hypothetical protein ACYC64_04900 [Armatimonadota bacterium]
MLDDGSAFAAQKDSSDITIIAELTYGMDLTCDTNGPNFCTSLQPLTGLTIGHSYDTSDISS